MSGGPEDTIAALSTPPGESGIAVIRVSGDDALSILSSIFHPPETSDWEHRRIYHGHLVDGDDVVDEVMCAVMVGPDTYTGEHTVEISCHGGPLVVERVLDLLFTRGARAAEAGEFTKRAFLAGKLDLIQAEAVADLIHARSELQRQVAQEQLSGALSQRINVLAGEMLDLLGLIEANIDFIEEDIDTIDYAGSLEVLERHQAELDTLLESAPVSRPFREGYHVALAGPVNVGKSSIFNRILGESRAIVTEFPGTTRDVLREPIVLEGVLFTLQDTAGLRGTDDQVESIGVGLAETALAEADVVLFVVDQSEEIPHDTPIRIASLAPERTIVVFNKADLPREEGVDSLINACGNVNINTVAVSAKTGEGIADLRRALIDRVGRDRLNWIARERVVLNARLVAIIGQLRGQLDVVVGHLVSRAPLEILALDAREALHLYESATGKRYTDDLLDTIFSRFCIGK